MARWGTYQPPREVEQKDPLDTIIKGLNIASTIYGLKDARTKAAILEEERARTKAERDPQNVKSIALREDLLANYKYKAPDTASFEDLKEIKQKLMESKLPLSAKDLLGHVVEDKDYEKRRLKKLEQEETGYPPPQAKDRNENVVLSGLPNPVLVPPVDPRLIEQPQVSAKDFSMPQLGSALVPPKQGLLGAPSEELLTKGGTMMAPPEELPASAVEASPINMEEPEQWFMSPSPGVEIPIKLKDTLAEEIARIELQKERNAEAYYSAEDRARLDRERLQLDRDKFEWEKTHPKSRGGGAASEKQLPSETRTKVGMVDTGLDAINKYRELFKQGKRQTYVTSQTPLLGHFVGDDEIDQERLRLEETIGRLNSGGAINMDETKRFRGLIPRAPDKDQFALRKLDELEKEFLTKRKVLVTGKAGDIPSGGQQEDKYSQYAREHGMTYGDAKKLLDFREQNKIKKQGLTPPRK